MFYMQTWHFSRYFERLAWSGHHILLAFNATELASVPDIAEGVLLCQSSFYFGQRSAERGRQSSSRPP